MTLICHQTLDNILQRSINIFIQFPSWDCYGNRNTVLEKFQQDCVVPNTKNDDTMEFSQMFIKREIHKNQGRDIRGQEQDCFRIGGWQTVGATTIKMGRSISKITNK